ncbi:hypothetical protein AAFF_G00136100 [Aldrovandia affinis]|uniref:C-type lectin domain-containing protein n=1 Tax=Aldrovandia affinis TaxID=143900 RepID=A0AAD7RQ01_9TELE|nr:hypothetical protein AAFF_G00136100 [Aldrovandia affinis]
MGTSTVSTTSEGIYIGLVSPDQNVYSTVGQTPHNSPGAQPTEISGQSSHPNRLAAVCLGLLCALLLIANIVWCVVYMSASQNCSMTSVEESRDYDAVVVKCPILDRYCTIKRVCRPCPEGWEESDSKCYYVSTERRSWRDSRSDCLKLGADLVIIESIEEQEFISKLTNRKGEDLYWIGLSETEGTWLWVDGTPLQEDKEFWWGAEPGDEHCAGKRKPISEWHFYSWPVPSGQSSMLTLGECRGAGSVSAR